jgi:oligopeptide transport system substrate-binding protein
MPNVPRLIPMLLLLAVVGLAAAQPTSLRYPLTSDPATFEPGLAKELLTQEVALNLHIGLFTYDADTEVVPYHVQRYEVTPDGLTYTFHLHEGAVWHNGRPIVAADYKLGWERYLDAALGSQTAGDPWRNVVGGPEMFAGTASELTGVRALDEHTLEVRLTNPNSFFLHELAVPSMWVVPIEAVVPGEPRWVDRPVGGGPFRFVEWRPGSLIVLEANDDFFLGRPAIDRIEYHIVPDTSTSLAQYEAGELDIVAVPPAALQRVTNDARLSHEVQHFTRAQLQYVGMNQSTFEPFRDPRVRQAFFHAIDRDVIAERVQNGAWANATGLVPPNIPQYDPELAVWPYDPERARELLAEAGYPGGQGFPRLEIATLASTVGEAVAAMLGANLGIAVEVIQPERGDYIAGLWSHDRWTLFAFGWTADTPSASVWTFEMLYCGLDSNFSTYCNAEVDAAIDEARSIDDVDVSTAAWRRAERIAMEDAALIPLGYSRFIYLVRPGVEGFAANLFGPVSFAGVSR